MGLVGCELAACADDADQAEDEGVDPAGAAVEAMAAADEERNDQRGKVNGEFSNGDTASRVELHLDE